MHFFEINMFPYLIRTCYWYISKEWGTKQEPGTVSDRKTLSCLSIRVLLLVHFHAPHTSAWISTGWCWLKPNLCAYRFHATWKLCRRHAPPPTGEKWGPFLYVAKMVAIEGERGGVLLSGAHSVQHVARTFNVNTLTYVLKIANVSAEEWELWHVVTLWIISKETHQHTTL